MCIFFNWLHLFLTVPRLEEDDGPTYCRRKLWKRRISSCCCREAIRASPPQRRSAIQEPHACAVASSSSNLPARITFHHQWISPEESLRRRETPVGTFLSSNKKIPTSPEATLNGECGWKRFYFFTFAGRGHQNGKGRRRGRAAG